MSKTAEQPPQCNTVYLPESFLGNIFDIKAGEDWFGVVTREGDYAVHVSVTDEVRHTVVSAYRVGVIPGQDLRYEEGVLVGDAHPELAPEREVVLPPWIITPPVTEHDAKEALASSYGTQAIAFVRAYIEAQKGMAA